MGITRSRERLFLSYCEERNQYGRAAFRSPSRFLRELPADTLRRAEGRAKPFVPKRTRSAPRFTAPADPAPPTSPTAPGNGDDYRVGQQVLHPTFGRGTIKVKEVSNAHPKLLIHFEGIGLKLIYPKFVELKRL